MWFLIYFKIELGMCFLLLFHLSLVKGILSIQIPLNLCHDT